MLAVSDEVAFMVKFQLTPELFASFSHPVLVSLTLIKYVSTASECSVLKGSNKSWKENN